MHDIEQAALRHLIVEKQLDLILSKLSPRQIAVLEYRLDGLTHEEISVEFGVDEERIDRMMQIIHRRASIVRLTNPILFE